jgi:hypothetical protein
MRTTLDIDDGVLLAVREIARQRCGRRVSKAEDRNGVPLLPRRTNGPIVTAELVNRLRDEDE